MFDNMGKKVTNEDFIKKANKIHNYLYDYCLIEYINNLSFLKIKCIKHGIFEQRANVHLLGCGCQTCKKEKISHSLSMKNEVFIRKAKLIHGKKYIYISEYKGMDKTITIKCNKCHNIFSQIASNHISGKGCIKCGFKSNAKLRIKSKENFILLAKKIHNENYNYDLIDYNQRDKKINIFCNKCKQFFLQIPQSHLNGNGCPKCNTLGKVSEPKLFDKLKQIFLSENIISQYKPEWLRSGKRGGQQSIDIYLPDYNIAIEYQGKLHFKSDEFLGGEKALKANQERDERKRQLCIKNNVKLFYFTYQKNFIPFDYPHEIFTNEKDLINIIRNEFN